MKGKLAFHTAPPNAKGEPRCMISLRGRRPGDKDGRYSVKLAEIHFWPYEHETLLDGVEIEESKPATTWGPQDTEQLQELVSSPGVRQLFTDLLEAIEDLRPAVWVLPRGGGGPG